MEFMALEVWSHCLIQHSASIHAVSATQKCHVTLVSMGWPSSRHFLQAGSGMRLVAHNQFSSQHRLIFELLLYPAMQGNQFICWVTCAS